MLWMWTFYQPPKSRGFGHVATPRNPLAAWRVLETFINDHALASEWVATTLISPKLPFKFRPNYFRRAVVTTRGDAFKLLRATPKVT
jgi:hypothetical protein